MHFGTFALTDKSLAGTRTIGGTDDNIDNVAAASNGTVVIDGEDNQAITVSVIDTTLTETGGDTMAVTVTLDSPPTALDSGGAATINVTGSLAVKANQTIGDYTGTAVVTIIY
ncbi:MAG: DUF4402 domain-containing protein [Proteobacteria bacterium]|nr:DUF4402 domain-containing protein [Pseudomonadota bacterium]